MPHYFAWLSIARQEKQVSAQEPHSSSSSSSSYPPPHLSLLVALLSPPPLPPLVYLLTSSQLGMLRFLSGMLRFSSTQIVRTLTLGRARQRR
eukprot:749198-Hanusia_phi.AAC.1